MTANATVLSLADRTPIYSAFAETGFLRLNAETTPDEAQVLLAKLGDYAAKQDALRRALIREYAIRHLREFNFADPTRLAEVVFGRIPAAVGPTDDPPRLLTAAQIRANPDLMRPPRILLPRLAWSGRATLIAGPGKEIGKSTLMRHAIAAYTQGRPFMGSDCGTPGTVLWWTGDREPFYEQIASLDEAGANMDMILMPERPLRFHEFVTLTRQTRPSLVVLDTIYSCLLDVVEDENSSSAWQPVLNQLRDLMHETEAGFNYLHHTGSMTGKSRGSTAVPGSVDMILTLKTASDDPRSRLVECRGRWTQPDWRYRMDAEGALALEFHSGTVSLDAQVLDAVERSPGVSGNRLGGMLKARRADVSVAVKRLEREGQLVNDGTPDRPLWRRAGA